MRLVRDDDGIEAFRQLNNRFDPQTALTKSHRLKQIQWFSDKNRATKKNVEVPALLARFEDMLFRYQEDYPSDALSARALTAGGSASTTEPALSGPGQRRPRRRKTMMPLQ